MVRWRFLRIKTKEILKPSPDFSVAIGVTGKMVRFGPMIRKTSRFTGNVYKLEKSYSHEEYNKLPKETRLKMELSPFTWDVESLSNIYFYSKAMTWEPMYMKGEYKG